MTTPEIAQVLTQRSYFNTFGGNPVCTAGGLAVLRVLEKEKLQENACTVGSYLKERLKSLQEKHESKGLFVYIEYIGIENELCKKIIEEVRGEKYELIVERYKAAM